MSFVTGLDFGAPAGAPEDWVVSDARATAAERVGVYQYMYGARLIDALGSQFPCVAAALGSEGFAAAVMSYLERHPSRHPSIRELGRRLPVDLRSARSPVGAMSRAALADLAALEWARADVFDALDEELVGVDALREQAPETFAALRLTRTAASCLVVVDHPIAGWWDALAAIAKAATESDCTHQPTSVAEPPPKPPAPGRQTLLVWRQGISVFHRPVDAREERALRTLEGGTTLGILCDQLADGPESEAEDVVAQIVFGWLWTWAKDGLLC